MKIAPYYLLSLVSMLLIRELNCKETAHHHDVRGTSSKPGSSSRDESEPDDSMLEEIEFAAMLIRCPQQKAGVVSDMIQSAHKTTSNISVVRTEAILQFPGYEKDEGGYASNVANCRRKVVITLKIHSSKQQISSKYRYVVVDHVFDPFTGTKSRLANMYVVKVRVQPSLQLYGLHFKKVVNGEVKEEVISKATNKTFTGCDATSINPTCGTAYFNGKKIPYSEGFCCSCDASVNARRQPTTLQQHNVMQPANHMYSPAYHDGVKSPESNATQQKSTSESNLNHTTTPNHDCQTTPSSPKKKCKANPNTREGDKGAKESDKKLGKSKKLSDPVRKQTVDDRPISECHKKILIGKLENEAKKSQSGKPSEASFDKPMDTKDTKPVGSSDDVKGSDEKHASSCQTESASTTTCTSTTTTSTTTTSTTTPSTTTPSTTTPSTTTPSTTTPSTTTPSTTTPSTTAKIPCPVPPSAVGHLRESQVKSSDYKNTNHHRAGVKTKLSDARRTEQFEDKIYNSDFKSGTLTRDGLVGEASHQDALKYPSIDNSADSVKYPAYQHQNSFDIEKYKSGPNIEDEASDVCFSNQNNVGDADSDKTRTNQMESEVPETFEMHDSNEDRVSLEKHSELSNHYKEKDREELNKQLSKDTPKLTQNVLSEKVHVNGYKVMKNKESNSQLSYNIYNPSYEPMRTEHRPLKHHRVDYLNHDELGDNLKPKVDKHPTIFSSDAKYILNQDYHTIFPDKKNCNPQQSSNVYSFESKPINNQISSQQGNKNHENSVKYLNKEAFEYGAYKPLVKPTYERNSRLPNYRESSNTKNYETHQSNTNLDFKEHQSILLATSETPDAFTTKQKYAPGNENQHLSSKTSHFYERKPKENPLSSEELAQKYFRSALQPRKSQSQHALSYQPNDNNVESKLKPNTQPQSSPGSYNYHFNSNQRPSDIRPGINSVHTPISSGNLDQNADSLNSQNHNHHSDSQMKQPLNDQPRDRTAHTGEVNAKTSVHSNVASSTANCITENKANRAYQGIETKSQKPNTVTESEDRIHTYKEMSRYDQIGPNHNANNRNQANSLAENRKYSFEPHRDSKHLNGNEADRNHPAKVNLTHVCTTEVPKQNTNTTCKAETCVNKVTNRSESCQKSFDQKLKGKCKFDFFKHRHESTRKLGSPSGSIVDTFLSGEHSIKPFNFCDLFHDLPKPSCNTTDRNDITQSPAAKTGKNHTFLKESHKLFEKLSFKHRRPTDEPPNGVEKLKSDENSAKVGNACTDKPVSCTEAKCYSTAKPCKPSEKPCTHHGETNKVAKTGTKPSKSSRPMKPSSSSETPCDLSTTSVPTSTAKPCKSFEKYRKSFEKYRKSFEKCRKSSKATFSTTSTTKPCKSFEKYRKLSKATFPPTSTVKPCKPNDSRFDVKNEVVSTTTAKPCKPNDSRFDAESEFGSTTTAKSCKPNVSRFDVISKVWSKTTAKPCKPYDNRFDVKSKGVSTTTAKPCKPCDSRFDVKSEVWSKTTAKPCKPYDSRFDAESEVGSKTTAKPCKPYDSRFDAESEIGSKTTAKPCKPYDSRFDAESEVGSTTTAKPCKPYDSRFDVKSEVWSKTTAKPSNKIDKHHKNVVEKTYLIEPLLHDSNSHFSNQNRKLQDTSTCELLSVPSSVDGKGFGQISRREDLERFNNEARIHKADELANYPERDSLAIQLAKKIDLDLAEDIYHHGRDMIDTLTRDTPQGLTQAYKLDNEMPGVKGIQQVSQPTNEELLRAYNSLFETDKDLPASNSQNDGTSKRYINKILKDASFSNPNDMYQLKYPSLGDGLKSDPRKRGRRFVRSKKVAHRTRKKHGRSSRDASCSHRKRCSKAQLDYSANKATGCVGTKRSLCNSKKNKCRQHSNEIQIKTNSEFPHLKPEKLVKPVILKTSLKKCNETLDDRLQKAHHQRPGSDSIRAGPCITLQKCDQGPVIGILEHCTDDLQPEKNRKTNCKTSDRDSEASPASRKSYGKTLQSGPKHLEDQDNVDDEKRIELGSDAPLKERAGKHRHSFGKKQKRKLKAVAQDKSDDLDFRRNLLREPAYNEHSDELLENPLKEQGVDHSHTRCGQHVGVERSLKPSAPGHRVNLMNDGDIVDSVPHYLTHVVPEEIAESSLEAERSRTGSIDSDKFELVSPAEPEKNEVAQSSVSDSALGLNSLGDALGNVLIPSEETLNEKTDTDELFPNKRSEKRKHEMRNVQAHSNLFRGVIRDTPFVDSFVQYDESDPSVEGAYGEVLGDNRFTVAFAEDGEVRVRRRGLRKNATKVIVDANSLSFFPVGSSEVDYIDDADKEDADEDGLKGDQEADNPHKDGDKNYDGRIPLKLSTKVKRSHHGGGARNHLKIQIPTTVAPQDNQDGKPKPGTNQAKPDKAYNKKEYDLKKLLWKRHTRKVKSKTFEIPLSDEEFEVLDDTVEVNGGRENSRGEEDGARQKRQMLPSGVQVRGGQNCPEFCKESETHYPPAYHESAHCLRFSDLWYNVYSLDDPVVSHSVHAQLFERITLEDGSTHWHDHTAGQAVKIGTFNIRARDVEPTISFTYEDLESTDAEFSLDPQHSQILIPLPVPSAKEEMYPEAQGGPGEYLVVPSRLVDGAGEGCDVAGVSYEGFSRQPDRCNKPRGACLANQPAQMWRADMEARITGARGAHFLENYGDVPTRAVLTDSLGARFLALFYDVDHVGSVAVEVKADFNTVIRVGSNAQITEIHADSTDDDVHTVSVVVTNTGLASSSYAARITDCHAAAPANWSQVTGEMVDISPQSTHVTRLQLDGQLPSEVVHCSVEVVNDCKELVATRRFRLRRSDRCLCIWYCLCSCINAVNGFKCDSASDKGGKAGGFGAGALAGIGSFMPLSGSGLTGENGPFELFAAWFLLFLIIGFVLGFLKAFFGFILPKLGAAGIYLLFCCPVKQQGYHECELRGQEVVYDENGFPVHPRDRSHTVAAFPPLLQMLVNLFFFVVLPFALVARLCQCCICGGGKGSSASMCELGGLGAGKGGKKRMGACGDKMCFDTYEDDDERESDAHNLVRNELRKSKQELGKGEKDPLLGNKGGAKTVGYVMMPSTPGKSQRYVDRLVDKRNVYKSLSSPEHGVEMPPKIPYCIRGFFLKTVDGYKWVTPEPLMQFWAFSYGDLKLAKPPRKLNARDFEKSYRDAEEVYAEKSLSLLPRGFCINVKFQDDMPLIEDEETSRGTFTGDSEQSHRSRPMRR